jgi:hypothetical protein
MNKNQLPGWLDQVARAVTTWAFAKGLPLTHGRKIALKAASGLLAMTKRAGIWGTP